MNDGPTGPTVIANLPLHVGVAERSLKENVGKAPSPAEAEARMLELLNRTRVAAGLSPVRPDDELVHAGLEPPSRDSDKREEASTETLMRDQTS